MPRSAPTWNVPQSDLSLQGLLRAMTVALLLPVCALSGSEPAVAVSPDDPDSYLEKKIYHDLAGDPLVSALDLEVRVDSGRVTLRGSVSSLYSKWAATRQAGQRIGVRRVLNRLTVDRNPYLTDSDISAAVGEVLRLNPYVSQYEFSVNVKEGTVSLGGMVRSVFERRQAVISAAMVEGVAAVSDNIAVSTSALIGPAAGPVPFTTAPEGGLIPDDTEIMSTSTDSVLNITVNGKPWSEWLREGYQPPFKRNTFLNPMAGYYFGTSNATTFAVALSFWLLQKYVFKDKKDTTKTK